MKNKKKEKFMFRIAAQDSELGILDSYNCLVYIDLFASSEEDAMAKARKMLTRKIYRLTHIYET